MKRFLLCLVLLLICLSCVFSYDLKALNELLEAQNLDVLKAKEELTQSLLDYKDAKAGFAPVVDLTITGSYLFNPIAAIRLNRDQLSSWLGIPSSSTGSDYLTLYKGQENTMYQFQLQITQPLFTWGKLSTAKDLYETVYKLRGLQVQSLVEQKQLELKTRLTALHYLKQVVSFLKEQQVLANQLVEFSNQAFINGVVLELDVLEAKMQARQLDMALLTAENEIESQLRVIASLVGLDKLSVDELSYAPSESEFFDVLNKPLLSLELNATSTNKLTFQLLAGMQEIANLTNKLAHASMSFKPDLALVAQLGYSGSRLPLVETDWYRKDSVNNTLTIAVKTTLFDGGKSLRNIDKTASKQETAQVDTALAKQEILETLRTNYQNVSLLKSKLEYYNTKLDVANQKIKMQESLLDAGSGSKIDLLSAQIEANNLQIEILQQKIELATSYNTILYLGT